MSIGPFLAPWLWRRLRRDAPTVRDFSAVRPDLLDAWGLSRSADERGLDFSLRPRSNAFETRLWVMRGADLGNYNKGCLAGWALDHRDPTADRRLVEFCLQAPMEAFVAGGEMRLLARRALSDRVPQAVIDERARGFQAVDWHEGLTAARDEVVVELGRLSRCDPVARVLDIARLRALVDDWPTGGWAQDDVMRTYRLALLRAVAAGHFLRKASGSNA